MGPVGVEETDLEVALRRLDDGALKVASSKALRRNETERHDIIADLLAVRLAILHHQRTTGAAA